MGLISQIKAWTWKSLLYCNDCNYWIKCNWILTLNTWKVKLFFQCLLRIFISKCISSFWLVRNLSRYPSKWSFLPNPMEIGQQITRLPSSLALVFSQWHFWKLVTLAVFIARQKIATFLFFHGQQNKAQNKVPVL